MGLAFTIRADGGARIERMFADLEGRLGDMSPLMGAISSYLRDSTRGRFHEGKSPDDAPWKPSRRAMQRGGQTLLDTGLLRDSIHDEHGRNFAAVETADQRAAGFHFGRTSPETVGAHTRLIDQVFGRPLPFPVYQTVRAHVRNPNIVARPIFGLSLADHDEIGSLVSRYLRSASFEH